MQTKKLVILVFLFLSGIFIFQGCQHSHSHDHAHHFEGIPELKERKQNLGTPAEWEKTHNLYGELRYDAEKDETDLETRLKLAELFIVEARITGEFDYYYEAAQHLLGEVLEQEPENKDIKFRTLALKSSVLLSLHQFEKALETGKEAIAINPYNAQIYGVMVDANVELGNYKKAVEMSDKMISIRPDLRSYSRVAYLREIHGDVDGAIQAWDMAIKAGYPGMEQTAWCRYTLGKLHETYGDLDNAELQYRTALAERPGYPYALAGLGSVMMKRSKNKEAEKFFTQACEAMPSAGFSEQLALFYSHTGNKEKAKTATDKALEQLHSHSHHGHETGLEHANIHILLTGKMDDALESALNEYEMRPKNIDVNKALARIYYEKGEMDKALEHLAIARQTNSQDPELLNTAGLILIKTNQEKEGKDLVVKAKALNPYKL